jgi:hypothetical protein
MKRHLPNGTIAIANLLSLDAGNSYGSGFQVFYEKYSFLVTANHVLFDEKNNLRCKDLRIICQNPNDLSLPNKALDIIMEDAQIFSDSSQDIAIVLLSKLNNTDAQNVPQALTYFSYVIIENGDQDITIVDMSASRLFSEIFISNQAYLFGYPMSLGVSGDDFFDPLRPLLRQGVVAGLNFKKRTFIIDCASYYGNSGGPVLDENRDGSIRIAGLVSKYIPLEIKWTNNRERNTHIEYLNSGYTVCIPMDAIFELIEKSLKKIKE